MISYNDIYEILRKEKYSEALQPLPKGFVEEFSDYLNERKDEFSNDSDLFQENVLKAKKQFENSITIFKELIRIRKKKLLNLAFVATETGIMKKDYDNMLNVEKEIFDSLVKSFEQGDKEISNMLIGKKNQQSEKHRMIMFNQDIEQFMDLSGKPIGPFTSGELANLNKEVADILVSGGKASFVDEE